MPRHANFTTGKAGIGKRSHSLAGTLPEDEDVGEAACKQCGRADCKCEPGECNCEPVEVEEGVIDKTASNALDAALSELRNLAGL